MDLRLTPLALQGLALLHPAQTLEPDARFTTFYSERLYAELGLPKRFVHEHASRYAARHTVRGLHFQTEPRAQTKLVRVAQGRIHDVVVDIRRASPTFGHHLALELAAGDWTQLVVPPGFAHGFCTLEPETEVVFRLDDDNHPELLRGLLWNDPALA